ncbi:uncharacterized protein Dwil_GK27677, partial [Drosophila willistoni]
MSVDTCAQLLLLTFHLQATFDEIISARRGVGVPNRSAFHIRVTDKLSFFKIDSSTNELPLSDIDFSLNPSTPQVGPMERKRLRMLTMRRMESCDEDADGSAAGDLPQISPLATNERPLSCNCSSFAQLQTHSHSKSLIDLGASDTMVVQHSPPPATNTTTTTNTTETPICGGSGGEANSSFEDDFQLSTSAPAVMLSSEFGLRLATNSSSSSGDPVTKTLNNPNNSPTASTLKLCKDLDELRPEKMRGKATSHSCGQLSLSSASGSASASAPVVHENPFRFTVTPSSGCFVSPFEPIAEHTATFTPPTPQMVYNLPTLLVTETVSTTQTTQIPAPLSQITNDTTIATTT